MKSTLHYRKVVRITILLFSILSVLSGCVGDEVPEDESPIDFDFSVSAHGSNVLMVKAAVITNDDVEVSIKIESSGIESRETSTSSASTEHDITVVGLRPETNYQFTALITNQSGETTTSEPQSFTTQSLPFTLPDIQLKTSSGNSYPGVTFF